MQKSLWDASTRSFYRRLLIAAVPTLVFALGVFITGFLSPDTQVMNDLQLTACFVVVSALSAFVIIAIGVHIVGVTTWGVFILFCCYCSMLVGGFHLWQQSLGYDPFATAILNGPYISVDSWSLIHVVLFAGIGFLFPDKTITMILYGFVWEGLEHVLTRGTSFWNERGINSVWDLWFNLVGYRLGEYALYYFIQGEQRRLKKAKQ